MHSYRNEQTDHRSTQVNQRITQEHMDSEHYVRWVLPLDMTPDTNGGIILPALGGIALVDHWWGMPDTGTPVLIWKLAIPEQWKTGNVQSTLFFSGGASSTANFSMTWRAFHQKVGSNVVTLTTSLTSANMTVAGPATAGDVKSATLAGLLPITQEWPITSWSLARNVGDANTGTLRILAVRHRYIPAKHEV